MTTKPTTVRPPSATGQEAEGQAEIQEFLDRLGRAVTAGDGKAAASLWAVPALVLGDEEARAIGALSEVESFFGGAKQLYNAKGITDTRPEIVELEWLTGRLVRVEVRWPYLDAAGAEKGDETSTYLLRRNSAGALKLHVAAMHGASE